MSFSDHLSSGVCLSVRPSVRLSVCLSVCKLFTFLSSSPEPLGQFQPNLAQSILGWRRFKFVQMKGPVLFQGEIIREQRKYIHKIKKIFFSRTSVPISTKLCTKHPWVKGIKNSSNEGPHPFPKGENYELVKINWRNLKFFFSRTTEPISSQLGTWHKASLGEADSILFKWRAPPFFKGR